MLNLMRVPAGRIHQIREFKHLVNFEASGEHEERPANVPPIRSKGIRSPHPASGYLEMRKKQLKLWVDGPGPRRAPCEGHGYKRRNRQHSNEGPRIVDGIDKGDLVNKWSQLGLLRWINHRGR